MKPKEIFQKHWDEIKVSNSRNYRIEEDFKLDNDAIADVVIFLDKECIGFGVYFSELLLPNENQNRNYFHRKESFIGCGTQSKFWFYFDKNNIIINDHKWVYPYDELMDDYSSFFQRIIQDE